MVPLLRRQHTSFPGASLCTYKVARGYFKGWSTTEPWNDLQRYSDAVFGNKIDTTKRALGHGDLEEQMLEGGPSLIPDSPAHLDYHCSAEGPS